ncbi:hypothetical protein RV10_GL001523 [Enterococcus pallens]|nr:hypothetical protein RV10_GL001523 [Enterococcus pallens]
MPDFKKAKIEMETVLVFLKSCIRKLAQIADFLKNTFFLNISLLN